MKECSEAYVIFGLTFITRNSGFRDRMLCSDHMTPGKGREHSQIPKLHGGSWGGTREEALLGRRRLDLERPAIFQKLDLPKHKSLVLKQPSKLPKKSLLTGENLVKPRNLDLTELSCDSEQRKAIKAVPVSNDIISRRADLSSGILK